jgi:GTP-sensing pleiotropic transcriptional regulator CodY
MTPQAPNTLIAHKAISLASELSNSERRVAAAIIDHFNRRTGQCDPSLDCIAELIGMSRRTAIRATGRLQKLVARFSQIEG